MHIGIDWFHTNWVIAHDAHLKILLIMLVNRVVLEYKYIYKYKYKYIFGGYFKYKYV